MSTARAAGESGVINGSHNDADKAPEKKDLVSQDSGVAAHE